MYSWANTTIKLGNALRAAGMLSGASTTKQSCNALRAASMYSGANTTTKLCNDLRAAGMLSGASTTKKSCNVLLAASLYVLWSQNNYHIRQCPMSARSNELFTRTSKISQHYNYFLNLRVCSVTYFYRHFSPNQRFFLKTNLKN